MSRKNALIFGAVMTSIMGFSQSSYAQPPMPNVFDGGNRWHITFYNDPTTVHQQWATQVICFLPYVQVGTSIQGAWYSLSFPDWNGRYYQEGDEVKMTGDYAKDVGHDHMTLLHTTYDVSGKINGMAFKDWTEWREDGKMGNIIGWGNSKLERMGRCPIGGDILDVNKLTTADIEALEAKAHELSLSLPDRLTLRGAVAQFPGQPDSESVDSYLTRTGLSNYLK